MGSNPAMVCTFLTFFVKLIILLQWYSLLLQFTKQHENLINHVVHEKFIQLKHFRRYIGVDMLLDVQILAPIGGPKKFWLIRHVKSRLEELKQALRSCNVMTQLRPGGHSPIHISRQRAHCPGVDVTGCLGKITRPPPWGSWSEMLGGQKRAHLHGESGTEFWGMATRTPPSMR